MKRFIYLVYILSLFIFMNLDIVNASYQCEYDYDKTNDGTEVVIKFDDDGTVSDITQDIAWDIYRWYFFAAHDSGIDVNAIYNRRRFL